MPEFDVIDVGAFSDDPSADALRDGGQKINANFERLAPENVSYSTVLDFSGNKHYAAKTITGTETLTMGTSFIRGGRVLLEFLSNNTGAERLVFPNRVRVEGSFDPARRNYVELVNTGDVTAGSEEIVARIFSMPRAPKTGLVFRHRANSVANLLESFEEALSINSGSGSPATEDQFSVMGQLEDYRQYDGTFRFRLKYFNSSGTQVGTDIVWIQRSNPADELVSVESVEGYVAVSGTSQLTVSLLGGGSALFGGLCLTASNVFSTWHGHPGVSDANAAFKATMGTTLFLPDTITPVTPGINATDQTVELYVETP